MNHKRGFTLIELLVVIATIAVLMAVLLPALHQARMQGQRVVCGTRLKEIGTSLNLYGQEFDDRLPPMNEIRPAQTRGHYTRWFRSGDGTWWNLGYVWKEGLIRDGRLFYCPSPDVRFKYKNYSEPNFPSDSLVVENPGTRISYMYNPICVSAEDRTRRFTRLSQLKATGTLLAADSVLDGSVPHMGGWNVLLGDFSVQQIMNREILELVETHREGIMETDYANFDLVLQLLLDNTRLE